MLAELTPKDWLGLTVVGTIISTVGAFLGIILKDLYISRRLETWKQERALEQLYERYRDPLVLSAEELCSRLIEIVTHYPTVYLHTSVLETQPDRQVENNTDDPYFRRYKLASTAYRFAAFLGWLELYRQEIVFLHPGDHERSKKLENLIEKIRADLADGQLNTAENWHEWKDILIFREELRAIGECMLESRGSARSVIGYGKFCDQFGNDPKNGFGRSILIILNFFLDLEEARADFRRIRLSRLVVHLVDLIAELNRSRLSERFDTVRRRLTIAIEKAPVWPFG